MKYSHRALFKFKVTPVEVSAGKFALNTTTHDFFQEEFCTGCIGISKVLIKMATGCLEAFL